ncbi:hypothetical protein FACS1894125_6530 [Actinomycetota bacterium]|nr:hypothetical protein FACS1894125_6530 [Actinomycetota bacterium]
MDFRELGVSDKCAKGCAKLGFTEPTEIQLRAIPVLMQGQDVTGIAQTGTGKTAAFGLPMLSLLEGQKDRSEGKSVAGLVLCPTRELAVQSANAIGTYAAAAGMHDLEITPIYGGAPYMPQKRAIRDGVDIVVATPGRLIDMMEKRDIDLTKVQMVVLDEADEMLKMGFQEDMETILEVTNATDRITALFSATMPNSIKKISDQYQNSPVQIQASKVASTAATIEQSYSVVPFSKKTEATRRLILATDAKAVIVFVKTRATAGRVSEDLTSIGVPAVVISGDVAQSERERIVVGMRKGKIKVLIATDVAARGLDIEAIELVINYDLPMENEAYVHRIGRTGRAGRKGEAMSFITPREGRKLESIEKLIGQKLTQKQIPTMSEVAAKQAKSFLHKAVKRQEVGHLDKYIKPVVKTLEHFETQEQLVGYVCALVALGVHDDGLEDSATGGQEFGDTLESGGKSGSGRGGRQGGRNGGSKPGRGRGGRSSGRDDGSKSGRGRDGGGNDGGYRTGRSGSSDRRSSGRKSGNSSDDSYNTRGTQKDDYRSKRGGRGENSDDFKSKSGKKKFKAPKGGNKNKGKPKGRGR